MLTLIQIAKEIKKRRKLLRISQNDLAEISGISLRSLKDIESGTGNPGINQIEKVLDPLGFELKLQLKLKENQ